jgi:hypothetical protein
MPIGAFPYYQLVSAALRHDIQVYVKISDTLFSDVEIERNLKPYYISIGYGSILHPAGANSRGCYCKPYRHFQRRVSDNARRLSDLAERTSGAVFLLQITPRTAEGTPPGEVVPDRNGLFPKVVPWLRTGRPIRTEFDR